MDDTRRLGASPTAMLDLATGQDPRPTHPPSAQSRPRRGKGMALRSQRPRTVVELRSATHEPGLSQSLLQPKGTARHGVNRPGLPASLVNCRMQNRTYGGVEGGRETGSLSDAPNLGLNCRKAVARWMCVSLKTRPISSISALCLSSAILRFNRSKPRASLFISLIKRFLT